MSSSLSDARSEQVTRIVEEGGYIAKVPVALIYESAIQPIGIPIFRPRTRSSSTKCAAR